MGGQCRTKLRFRILTGPLPRLERLDHVVTRTLASTTRSGIAASSLDHGSRVLGSAFWLISSSTPRGTCNRERRHSLVLQPLLLITQLKTPHWLPPRCTPVDEEAGGWIRSFSRLMVRVVGLSRAVPRAVTRVESISLDSGVLQPSWSLNPILSFPLPKDLTMVAHETGDDDGSMRCRLSSNPRTHLLLPGTLNSPRGWGLSSISCCCVYRAVFILGARFGVQEGVSPTMMLVETCPHTLESLDITRAIFSTPIWHPSLLTSGF